jgi:FtsP/CotA-like multicopper oxidase with cupredoxin domain
MRGLARVTLLAAATVAGSAALASQPMVRMPGTAASDASAGAPAPVSDYDPHSTPGAPCGKGTPLPGHALPEVSPGPDGITITVRQDKSRLCYVVDGIADAPVIRVRRGATLDVTLRNEITDPAAIEAVTAPGELKASNPAVPVTPGFYKVAPGMHHSATGATNLHVHGFAVPPVAPQDDTLTTCADPAVGPQNCGHRSVTYHYQVPGDMPAGLYWYHPHVHGEVTAQMLMGLSGPIVVESPADDLRRASGMRERVFIVRQTQDLDAGKASAAAMTAAAPDEPVAARPAGQVADRVDTVHELLCAASGGIDEISLNGTPVPLGNAPDDALAHVEFANGETQLWRVLNAATDAFLDLALVDSQGRPLPMQILARDGNPVEDDAGVRRHAWPTTQSQAVPPSGRIELLLPAPQVGSKAYLVTHSVDTGCAGDRVPERRLAVLTTSATQTAIDVAIKMLPKAPGTYKVPRAAPDMFAGLLARKTDRVRTIAFAEYPRPGSEDQTDFYIFERRPDATLVPWRMGSEPAVTLHAGTTEEWVIENWTHELHAFHIHQLHFRVLEIDGEKVKDPDLLDVVTVPYAVAAGYGSRDGPVRPGRVRVKLYFPPGLAGDLPFHCHLADHEDNGMMAVLRVLPPGP